MNLDRMKALYYGYQHDQRVNAVVDSAWLAGLQSHAQRMARYLADPDAYKGRFVQMRADDSIVRLRKLVRRAEGMNPSTWRAEFMDGPRKGEFVMIDVLTDTVDLPPLEELAWAEKLYADAG